ncbi:MAG: sarcosine oxidase subunit delta [Rhizobiaceae bacterium]
MIINCPYCGPRDSGEFTYQGDGTRTRPDPASTDQVAWNAYVYDRTNPAGEHTEIWQHHGGCRVHLAVVRNTLTHKISSVGLAREHGERKSAARRRAEA